MKSLGFYWTTFRRRAGHSLSFARAIRTAIGFRNRRSGSFRLFEYAKRAASLLRWITGLERRSDPKLWRLRVRACARCPIYNRAMRTCGTAGDLWIRPGTLLAEQEGCLCWIPAKASVLAADCWTFEVMGGSMLGIGWPQGLNGTEILGLLKGEIGS